jgi:PBP1b-binding outer membrane lipoprotein LpoB
MKKIIIISFSALILIACSEQQQYKETVLEQITNDPDIQSYHLDPQSIADCIVDLSSTTKKISSINNRIHDRARYIYFSVTSITSSSSSSLFWASQPKQAAKT